MVVETGRCIYNECKLHGYEWQGPTYLISYLSKSLVGIYRSLVVDSDCGLHFVAVRLICSPSGLAGFSIHWRSRWDNLADLADRLGYVHLRLLNTKAVLWGCAALFSTSQIQHTLSQHFATLETALLPRATMRYFDCWMKQISKSL